MDLKKIAILALGSAFLFGCQNNTEKQADQEGQENQAVETSSEQPANQQEQMQNQFGQQAQQVAPSDVSDQELQQVASAIMKMQIFNQQIQQQMIDAVETQGLDAQRFTEIQQAQQNPNQESSATDEELKNFELASDELMKIQMEAQKEMEEMITGEGLTLERYEGIAMLIQQDTSMQKKFQSIMQEMAP